MREILFRGKRFYNGEWVEGYYAAEPYMKNTYNCGYILENKKDLFAKKACLVDSRTVGQYTGLTDKNGRKIFEGDIIHLEYSQVFFGGEYFGEYTAEVSYKEGCFITDGTYNGDEIETPLSGFDNDEVEIIGNIHDTPELLGGESDG